MLAFFSLDQFAEFLSVSNYRTRMGMRGGPTAGIFTEAAYVVSGLAGQFVFDAP
jgi:hypothetical protein